MTTKESKAIDFVFTMAIIASNRNADKAKLLSAVCFDIDLIRKGYPPRATKELV
tara:strand:+ start:83 stop:244 length:162 start_codon:yes stop_codon:yes gene_type:complete